MRLLIIGSFYPEVSGTVVLLKQLLRELNNVTSCYVDVIDTGRISKWGGIFGKLRFILVLIKIFRTMKHCDVVCPHLSPNGMVFSGPFLILFAKLYKKPVVTRMFGGFSYSDFESRWKRILANYLALNSASYCLETHELLRRAKKNGAENLEWFPNSRPVPSQDTPQPEHAVRAQNFLFVSQIKREKGVLEAIEAMDSLPNACKLTIYGPLNWNLSESDLNGYPNVSYLGELAPDAVAGVIQAHDVFILPSFMDQEGYPGVIIEAYAQGRPVIVSDWKALPEMVDHEKSGLIVEARSVSNLSKAILRLHQDPYLYSKLCSGAWSKRIEFSSEIAKQRYLDICYNCLK